MSQAGEKRPHVLVAGWCRNGTGFTRVLNEVITRLQKRARVTWVGIGASGDTRVLANGASLVPVAMGRGDPVGAYLIGERWNAWQPDAVLVLNDLWYLEHYARVLGPVRGQVPMLGYLPMDGDIPDDLQLPDLRAFSSLATFTRHAARNLREHLSAQGQDLPVAVVGHGVDTVVFKPKEMSTHSSMTLDARAELAQQLFGLDEPTVVILNASRADPRKRIDRTIEGFAAYVQQSSRPIKLCLHQAIAHDGLAEVLRARIDALGIQQHLLWWPRSPGPLTDASLADLYNACAVGINTSMGEGFGLVSFEHAACGVPQLVPDHPALAELWGDAATRIGPVLPEPQVFSPLHMASVTAPLVAEGLASLLASPEHYQRMSVSALARATAPTFQWDVVADALWRLLADQLNTAS